MAAPAAPNLELRGPSQAGRGVQGQYVYWIVMPHLTPETLALTQVKTPAEFTHDSFRELVVEAHTACDITVEETACFLEPHANGLPHFNLLARALTQYRWKKVAEYLLKEHRVHVSFGENVRTWAEGVAYGRVPSEHKPEEGLDKDPVQWHRQGCPTPFEQFLPRRWQQPGFVRKTRLTNLAFFDLCREHALQTETELWAKATELSDAGDRGLLAYLLEADAGAQLAKVLQATGAQEATRRAKLSREALLEEFLAKERCCCHTEGHCYGLMKQVLHANGLDGRFQAEVLAALRTGRAKMRTICLLGAADCGKSFLFKGLRELFKTYERPDGGSYQLEDLVGSELVFLNDFEYDAGAKDWMPWCYFKNFLEGGDIKVGRPKNRGGNTTFKGTAPVFMTAPQEVTLTRRGHEVPGETVQMRKRIRYLVLKFPIPEDMRQEVLRVCPHCSAKVYLEGRCVLDQGVAPPAAPARLAPQPPPQNNEPSPKRPRTAKDCLQELKGLKELLDNGALSQQEFADLKARLLAGT